MIFLALVLAAVAFGFGAVIGWTQRDRLAVSQHAADLREIRRLRNVVDVLARPSNN